jgi:hypothetical protein
MIQAKASRYIDGKTKQKVFAVSFSKVSMEEH